MIKPPLATTITSLLVCLNITPCFAGTASSRTTTSTYSSSTESVAERELRRRYEYVQNGEAAIAAGDKAMKERDYEQARAQYKRACDLIPDSLNTRRLHRRALPAPLGSARPRFAR